jgi:hypothetical protein
MEAIFSPESSVSPDGKAVIFATRFQGRPVKCSVTRSALEQHFRAPIGAVVSKNSFQRVTKPSLRYVWVSARTCTQPAVAAFVQSLRGHLATPELTKPSCWENLASRRFMHARMAKASAQPVHQGFRGALKILCETGITVLAAAEVASDTASVARCGAVR